MARTRQPTRKPAELVERRSAPAGSRDGEEEARKAERYGTRPSLPRSRSNSRAAGEGESDSDGYASTTEDEDDEDDEDDEAASAGPAAPAAPLAKLGYTGPTDVSTAVVPADAAPVLNNGTWSFTCSLDDYEFLVPDGASLKDITTALAPHVPSGRADPLAQLMVDCMVKPGKELVFDMTAVPPGITVMDNDGNRHTEVSMLSLSNSDPTVDVGDDDEEGEYYVCLQLNFQDDWCDGSMHFNDRTALESARALMTQDDFEKILNGFCRR